MTSTDTDSVIRAAGAVVWRSADPVEVAVVHRPRYDDWTLPKGKLADGEIPPAAAVREVREETGHDVALGRRLGQAHYVVRSELARQTGPKVVDYWAAESLGGAFAANAEVDRLRWLPPAAARRLLSYDFDRTILDRFAALPVPTATLLLVRHGKAGNRSDWPGDDDLRPLTDAGLRQAKALCDLLLPFAPSRIHSAPLLRCTQTVEPLAEHLGVGVFEEPLLSEEGYGVDPIAGRRRLLEMARDGCRVVACSQGGVIPDMVYAVAGEAAVDDEGEVPAKKGSTWVLSLRGDDLLAADYYPPP